MSSRSPPRADSAQPPSAKTGARIIVDTQENVWRLVPLGKGLHEMEGIEVREDAA